MVEFPIKFARVILLACVFRLFYLNVIIYFKIINSIYIYIYISTQFVLLRE